MDNTMINIYILAILVIIVLIIYARYLTKKTTQTWMVNIDAKTVLAKAIHGLSINGFIPQSKDESSVTLVREKKPNCIIGGGLLCLCAVPAIIYAIIGGSKEPLIISVNETEGRTEVTATGIKAWLMHLKKIL